MITFINLKVEGVPFDRLLKVEIRQEVNEHGYAKIQGEMTTENAKSCVERSDETTKIKIYSEKDPKQTLFVGAMAHIDVDNSLEYSIVTIELITSSFLLDVTPHSRSFQSTKSKYAEILSQVYKEKGSIEFKATDKAAGGMVLQLEETDWAFTKRIASLFNASVFVSATAEKPTITVGRPASKNKGKLKDVISYQYAVDHAGYQALLKGGLAPKGKEPILQDFSVLIVKSPEYLELGDEMSVDGKTYYVRKLRSVIEEGILMTTYELAGKTGFFVPVSGNPAIVGRIMTGQVKEVKEDKVQVHLLDIDEKYDTAGDCWLPYSTPYSSSDGSGWYVMPEKDDYVRVLFPSQDVTQAFAASTVNTAPGKEVKDKRFKAPQGKEILFTDKGLYIICKHQKVFIDLTDKDGIQMVSAGDINVIAKGNVTLSAGKDVQVLAQKQVLLGTPGSAVTITPSKITMSAQKIVLA